MVEKIYKRNLEKITKSGNPIGTSAFMILFYVIIDEKGHITDLIFDFKSVLFFTSSDHALMFIETVIATCVSK